MKIQNINNYMSYKNSAKPIKNDESVKAKNYDVIDIKNKSEHANDDITLNSIKKKVVSQVNNEATIDKINKIKESFNNNTYKIDVDEIVRKLLK